jgi:anti-sigma-K factor RskA
MTHDDVQALASDYVLGLVDEVTRARVASHLKVCGSCSAEVRALAETCDALGRTVPDAAPPSSLRDRIVSIPGQVPQAVVGLPSAAPVTRRSSGVAAVLPWVAAVAAAVVAVTAIWQTGAARAEVQRLRQALAEAQLLSGQAQLARVSLQERLDEAERQASVLRASDAVTYTLVGNTTAKDSHARAFVTHKNGMIFTADGLPALPAGKTYQLWVIAEGKPVSVGVFAPDASGRVHAMMATPAIAVMPSAVAVTLEPAGGLAQPSTAPILVGAATPQ